MDFSKGVTQNLSIWCWQEASEMRPVDNKKERKWNWRCEESSELIYVDCNGTETGVLLSFHVSAEVRAHSLSR